MNKFFITLYSWFCERPTFKDLRAINAEEITLSSALPAIGITNIVISFIIAFAFYIWPLNHPRFKAWWSWLIMLVINALINFGLAFAFISHRVGEIKGNADLMDVLANDEGKYIYPMSNQFAFAFSNACVSILFFVVASLILTWFSTVCKYSPFRK